MPRRKYRLGWRALRRVVGRPDLTRSEYKQLARELAVAMVQENITTGVRARMFIAQTCHETGGYRWREELASGEAYDITVNASLARALGNSHVGDGRRYKGRSYIQITGRFNYEAISRALAVDFLRHPELLARPAWAARGAAWWWRTNGCNQIADTGDFIAVTRRINGGTNGLADRLEYHRRARRPSNRLMLIPKRRIRP